MGNKYLNDTEYLLSSKANAESLERAIAQDKALIPHSIISRIVNEQVTPLKAWREHLGHTQADIAAKLNFTQSAYAQIEASKHPQKATKRKIADALGISLEQLDI